MYGKVRVKYTSEILIIQSITRHILLNSENNLGTPTPALQILYMKRKFSVPPTRNLPNIFVATILFRGY